MRSIFRLLAATLLLLLLPSLALADVAPWGSKKSNRTKKPTPTPTVAPVKVELDEATVAKRDQLLADAKHKSDMAEFLESRQLYREALAIDHDSAQAKAGLAAVEVECLKNARRQISEAKAYQSAFNYSEAKKSLELALKYADLPTYKEHQQAKGMVSAINRETER